MLDKAKTMDVSTEKNKAIFYAGRVETMKLFEELKEFFHIQVEKGIFKEEQVTMPFYIWKGDGEEKNGMLQNGISVNNADAYGSLIIPIFLQMVL